MPGKEWAIPKERWNNEVLLVFARAPEAGRVKTRLAKDVGMDRALDLYKIFVEKTLSAARIWAKGGGPEDACREIWICYTPAEGEVCLKDWLGREYTFLAQTGSGLGDRMARAMAEAFYRGAAKAVLVGTDIPDMAPVHLETAFGELNKTDLVWGPSLDGGYWLVGAASRQPLKSVFRKIPWGTDQVLSKSIHRCKEAGLTWAILPALQDVDTLEDFKATRFYRESHG